MIKIVWIEFIPRLGNGRPENGTGTFVKTLMYRRYCRQGFELTTLYTSSRNSSLPIANAYQLERWLRRYSRDGGGGARARDYEYIAITDHSKGLSIANGIMKQS